MVIFFLPHPNLNLTRQPMMLNLFYIFVAEENPNKEKFFKIQNFKIH